MHRNRIAHAGDIGIFEHVTRAPRKTRGANRPARQPPARTPTPRPSTSPSVKSARCVLFATAVARRWLARLDLSEHGKRLGGIVGEVAAAVHHVQQVVGPLDDAACEPAERRGARIVAARIDEQQPAPCAARAQSRGGRDLPGDGGRVERGPRIPRGDHLHAGILEKTLGNRCCGNTGSPHPGRQLAPLCQHTGHQVPG